MVWCQCRTDRPIEVPPMVKVQVRTTRAHERTTNHRMIEASSIAELRYARHVPYAGNDSIHRFGRATWSGGGGGGRGKKLKCMSRAFIRLLNLIVMRECMFSLLGPSLRSCFCSSLCYPPPPSVVAGPRQCRGATRARCCATVIPPPRLMSQQPRLRLRRGAAACVTDDDIQTYVALYALPATTAATWFSSSCASSAFVEAP